MSAVHDHLGHAHVRPGRDSGRGHRHEHEHAHHPAPEAGPGDWRWPLAVGLNLAFVAIEFGFGVFAGSTALMADAGHNLSDVLGLVLAGGAALLARQAVTRRRTYGWRKATILAALANAVLLVFACGAVALEAVQRFADPAPVRSGVVMAVAAAGFAINLGTALLFWRGRHADMNVQGAFLHMAADAGVSLGVVAAGGLILLTDAVWIDPVVSLLIVAAVLTSTWGLFRRSLNLALDAAPEGADVDAVTAWLGALPGVSDVHHVHVWALSTTETALTAHLVREEAADAGFLQMAREGLTERFGIGHVTLQVEVGSPRPCTAC